MFKTLDDYRKKEDENEKKDKRKTTDSYTGGKSSGIAVENPEEDNAWQRLQKKEDKQGFDKTKNRINLKVYKNGFIVDNGPFRPLTDPENQKFFQSVEKGYIPQELVNQGYKDLGIAIEKKDEDYVEPVPEKKFEAFTGSGKSLGNVDTSGLKVNKNVASNVDKSKPTCKVNIRLFNGETVNEEFNLCQPFSEVVKFVEKASNSKNFQLLDGFPPKPITQMNKTIQELKLQGSTLTQRLG